MHGDGEGLAYNRGQGGEGREVTSRHCERLPFTVNVCEMVNVARTQHKLTRQGALVDINVAMVDLRHSIGGLVRQQLCSDVDMSSPSGPLPPLTRQSSGTDEPEASSTMSPGTSRAASTRVTPPPHQAVCGH